MTKLQIRMRQVDQVKDFVDYLSLGCDHGRLED